MAQTLPDSSFQPLCALIRVWVRTGSSGSDFKYPEIYLVAINLSASISTVGEGVWAHGLGSPKVFKPES